MPFTLYLLALAVFVMGTSEFMLAGLLPAIAAELDVSLGTAGLLTSAFAAGMVLGAPVMAAFARHWPQRLTLAGCLLLFAACHVVGAVTPVFWLLLTTRILGALANAGFLAVALSAALTLVPNDRKGRALSILLSGTTIATVAGVPAGALLGTTMGWRTTFWAVALPCLPAIVGVLRGVTTRPGHTAGDRDFPSLRQELSCLASPGLLIAMALGAIVNAGTFAVFTFLAPIVTDVAALTELWIPVALMAFGVGSFLGVTVSGRSADRHSGVILAVAAPLLLVGWIVMAACATQPVVLLVLAFTQGVLAFAVGSTLITLVLYGASGAPSMGGSYATAALNIGATLGPMLGALGLTTDQGLTGPVWIAGMLTAIAIVIMAFARGHLRGTAEVPG